MSEAAAQAALDNLRQQLAALVKEYDNAATEWEAAARTAVPKDGYVANMAVVHRGFVNALERVLKGGDDD